MVLLVPSRMIVDTSNKRVWVLMWGRKGRGGSRRIDKTCDRVVRPLMVGLHVRTCDLLRKKKGTLWIPSRHDYPPIRWIILDSLHDPCQLIDTLSSIIILTSPIISSKMSPLKSINWSQVPLPPMPQSDFI